MYCLVLLGCVHIHVSDPFNKCNCHLIHLHACLIGCLKTRENPLQFHTSLICNYKLCVCTQINLVITMPIATKPKSQTKSLLTCTVHVQCTCTCLYQFLMIQRRNMRHLYCWYCHSISAMHTYSGHEILETLVKAWIGAHSLH